jgi:hypothetical protein
MMPIAFEWLELHLLDQNNPRMPPSYFFWDYFPIFLAQPPRYRVWVRPR